MARTTLPSGIDIEYDTFGDPLDPALLLVMGYTAQMISWPEDVRAGARRRRASSSSASTTATVGCRASSTVRRPTRWRCSPPPSSGTDLPAVPYTLSDMAADGIGLLDHLGIERAHIAGASMGGMIVQTMAIEHPTRVASLTSIMSTIGDPLVGAPDAGGTRSAADAAADRTRGVHRGVGARPRSGSRRSTSTPTR